MKVVEESKVLKGSYGLPVNYASVSITHRGAYASKPMMKAGIAPTPKTSMNPENLNML
jgi:hypothetical protein